MIEWTDEKNERRCDLIDREIDGTLTQDEQHELAALQDQMLGHLDRVAPLPTKELRKAAAVAKRLAKGYAKIINSQKPTQ